MPVCLSVYVALVSRLWCVAFRNRQWDNSLLFVAPIWVIARGSTEPSTLKHPPAKHLLGKSPRIALSNFFFGQQRCCHVERFPESSSISAVWRVCEREGAHERTNTQS